MAGRTEDAVEGVGGGRRADGEAEAAGAVGTEFLEGFASVGFGVARFVAVVVGEAIGQHEQEAVGGAGVGLEEFAGVADGGAHAGIAGGFKLVEPGPSAGAEALSKWFEGQQMDGGPAPGAEAVDGDAVAEFLEGHGQGGGGAALVFVDGAAVGIDLGGGAGGVHEDEHTQVAGQLAALQIDVFGGGVAGAEVNGEVDEGVDVEILPIGSPADDLGTQTDAGQPTAEQFVVLDTASGDVGAGPERKLDDPAPLRPVPVLVDIPLRVQSAAHATGGAGPVIVIDVQRDGQGPRV